MSTSLDPEAPIVIGALGGSGTRVVGDILRGAGVHLGGNLNTASDAVTATVLFNRPRWAAGATSAEIRLEFERLRRFLLRRDLRTEDYRALLAAALRPGHTEGVRRRLRYARRVRREHGPEGATRWGWKEPNSHLFLSELADTFTRLRFVYVARHPLDMAFSENLNQLRNWAGRFGLEMPDEADADAVARSQLDLWIASTQGALEAGERRLQDRFLFLRFDDLLDDPRATVDRLLGFVGVEADETTRARLVGMPRRPSSDGRFRSHDLSVFRPDQLEAIDRLWGPPGNRADSDARRVR